MPKLFTNHFLLWILLNVCLLGFSIAAVPHQRASAQASSLDQELQAVLRQAGFTGRIESTLEQRLGRHLDLQLADLGRNLWFDTITGLNNDNTCAGSPSANLLHRPQPFFASNTHAYDDHIRCALPRRAEHFMAMFHDIDVRGSRQHEVQELAYQHMIFYDEDSH